MWTWIKNILKSKICEAFELHKVDKEGYYNMFALEGHCKFCKKLIKYKDGTWKLVK
jgi:hypothetical protein